MMDDSIFFLQDFRYLLPVGGPPRLFRRSKRLQNQSGDEMIGPAKEGKPDPEQSLVRFHQAASEKKESKNLY